MFTVLLLMVIVLCKLNHYFFFVQICTNSFVRHFGNVLLLWDQFVFLLQERSLGGLYRVDDDSLMFCR